MEVQDPCCEPCAQPSAYLSSLGKSNLEWEWMSNGPLQSKSMAAFTCSWSAVSHYSLLCGLVTPEMQISVSSRVPVVNSVRQLHLYLMGCAGNSHSAEIDSRSRKHDIRLFNKKYLCIRIALN